MADRYRASPLRVHLSPEDHEWLAKLAQDEDVSIPTLIKRAVQHFRYWQEEGEEALHEALEIFEAERSGHEVERQRRLYYQRDYELQSRRLHEMLRDERHRRWEQEKQLRDERDLRAAYEDQLRDERNLRAAYEDQLRDERNLGADREAQLREERDFYERKAGAPATDRYVPNDPTVAKLLTLAIRSESEAEAMAAFAKVRAIHRKNASYSTSGPR
jgi:hypothetical protein